MISTEFDWTKTILSFILGNKRTLYDFKEKGTPGVPDGMTIDTNGNLWVAQFVGDYVSRKIHTSTKTLFEIKYIIKMKHQCYRTLQEKSEKFVKKICAFFIVEY